MKVILMCFIFGTEFLKCLKYCKGGGGEVEEKTESSTSCTRSIHIFQIILFIQVSILIENIYISNQGDKKGDKKVTKNGDECSELQNSSLEKSPKKVKKKVNHRKSHWKSHQKR